MIPQYSKSIQNLNSIIGSRCGGALPSVLPVFVNG
jgi:hypothetical protein